MSAPAKLAPLSMEQTRSESNRIRASMRLDFSCDSAAGNTYLAGSSQETPLKVVRTFGLEDGTALAHLHNVSGGLLGGDQLELRVNVGCGARVQLTTTGATRIYRCGTEGSPTTQSNQILVGANGLLEYVPDAIIPYSGAHFLQRTTIHLDAGAGIFWWEILAPGREARGELFQYEQFEMRTSVTALNRKIAEENICLRPEARNIASLARLGPYRYGATFYICREGLDAIAWLSAEEHLREFTGGLTRQGEILWGVSALVAHGLVVRCVARGGREVLPGLHAIWRKAKFQLYGREAIPPRKVH